MQLPNRRKDALAQGISHYFTGFPCLRGHVAKRLTSDGRCIECGREKLRRPEEVKKRNLKAATAQGRAIVTKSVTKRYNEDPVFRLSVQLRSRMRSAFKAQGVRKLASCYSLTGCSPQELRQYLLRKAQETAPGATLENYGQWQIDHIRPVGSFDLTDPAQTKACFHYTNLQPLWKSDHQAKTKLDIAQMTQEPVHATQL